MNYRPQWKDGRMDGSFAERVCLWTGGTFVAVLVLGVALSTSVGAQNTDDLRVLLDRMEGLERDIRTLNLSLSRGRLHGGSTFESTPPSPKHPRTHSR